jgi:hypothetical protein
MRTLLDLSARGRVVVCALFFGCETALVATAGLRSDRSYGFRMFPESSSVTVHLSRLRADGTVTPIEEGQWQTHDCQGQPHVVRWETMVRAPAPWRLNASVPAPYGVDSEIHRTRDAMQWVLDHTPEDCETQGLVAKIDVRRNGQAAYEVDALATRDATKARLDGR